MNHKTKGMVSRMTMTTKIENIKNMDRSQIVENKVMIFDLLTEAANKYYNTDDKIMSDTDFDAIKDLYELYVEDFTVGAAPIEGKGTISVEHSFGHLVGSLSKVNSIEQTKEWIEKTVKDARGFKDNLRVMVSYKYDGNSVVIEFKDGKVIKALTRGAEGKGLDLTHAFEDLVIKEKRHIGVKFEVIMTYEDFKRLNDDTDHDYKNPRSVTAGILGKDDVKDYVKYLTLVPLALDVKGIDIDKDRELELISKNFDFNFNSKILIGTLDEVMAGIQNLYEALTTKRQNLAFMIDGIVIELLGSEYRDLGWVSNKPKWSCALKFPYMEETSKVTGFDFTLGNSGRITPRVWFKPVKFNGATQTKVSLANYDRFMKLGLGVDSDILVQYRNDVLSYVEKLDTEFNKTVEPIPFCTECPVCGGVVGISDTGAYAFCTSETCPSNVVGRLERYLTKLGIKGVKAATLEKLHENEMISDIPSLYKLDYEKVSKIEGLGVKSANTMKKAISGKIPTDAELLGGLGIDAFGNTLAKAVCRVYTIQELLEMSDNETLYDKINALEGFSHITTAKLVNAMKNMKDEIVELITLTSPTNYKDSVVIPVGNTYTFCITGSVELWANRDTLKKHLESLGHKVSGTVSSKTDFLVNNDNTSNSSKNKKAKDLNKPIITETELKKLLGE